MEKQNDRITVGMSRKMPVEQYGNFEVNLVYSCDKPEKVPPVRGIQAVEKLVIQEFERLLNLAEKGKIKGVKEE